MPCYTTREYTTVVGKMNVDVLVAGLKAAGWVVTEQGEGWVNFIVSGRGRGYYRAADGTLELPVDVQVNEVKVAYARAALQTAATRMGWMVNRTAQDNRLRLTRRA